MCDIQERGKQAAVSGRAHEHLVCGVLMKKFHNVSLVDLPHSAFDIIIVYKNDQNVEDIIRAQVKTARDSIPFKGGTRGRVDRSYISGIKEYTQSPEYSDVVIGLKPISDVEFDLYFVPTILIPIWGTSSKSINLIQGLKNNYEMLKNCKNYTFVIENALQLGVINRNQL